MIPSHLMNKKVGRFSSSPNSFTTELNKKRDELLHQFNKDHEMEYLKHQVRRMESPEQVTQRPNIAIVNG